MFERFKERRYWKNQWKEYKKNPKPGGPNVMEELPGYPWNPKGGEFFLPAPGYPGDESGGPIRRVSRRERRSRRRGSIFKNI